MRRVTGVRARRPRFEKPPVETGPIYIIDPTSNVHFVGSGRPGAFTARIRHAYGRAYVRSRRVNALGDANLPFDIVRHIARDIVRALAAR